MNTVESGTLSVVTGCMFAGKSEKLIRMLKHAKYEKKKVIAFKPSIDNRYSESDIASHEGKVFPSIPVSHSSVILTTPGVAEAQVVGIDEVQFFDESIVEVCLTLVGQGKRVYVAGLDTDFRGIPFGPIPHLLAVADVVEKRHAACVVCGGNATRSQRVVPSTERVVVGDADAYEARCRLHWSPEPVFTQMERGMSEALDG